MLHEAKMLIEAYRREKQKAEVGAQDPAETSWKLIKVQVQKDDKFTVKNLTIKVKLYSAETFVSVLNLEGTT